MNRINITGIKLTEENLKKRIESLRQVLDRLEPLEEQAMDIDSSTGGKEAAPPSERDAGGRGKSSGSEKRELFQRTLALSRESVEENIRVLSSMAAALEEVYLCYTETEKRIADRYNLESVPYPKTVFGISRITGLDEHEDLMPF